MQKRSGYLATLDGWRAIAVLFVIFYHDALRSFGLLSTQWVQDHGVLGVDIFFGISGLLICSRMLDEESTQGSINLKKFYIRRAFRILPPALFYLIVLAVLGFLGILPVLPKEWFASLFFYRNYNLFSTTIGHMDWFTAHFWSLSVEEHFYLILPGTLVFVPKRLRLAVLGAMVAAIDLWRVYRLQTRPLVFLLHHTDTRLDALLVPAMIAIILSRPQGRALLLKVCRFWFIPAAVLLYLLTWSGHPAWALFFQAPLIPIMILGTVLYPHGYFARILELTPIRWLGRISYSLYLWQDMFFLERFFPNYHPLGWMQTFPWRFILLLACATTSYYLVEKPMIKWGHKLAPAATPSRPEISDAESSPSAIL